MSGPRAQRTRNARHIALVSGLVLAAILAVDVPAKAQPQASSEQHVTRVEGVAAFVGGTGPGVGVDTLLRSDVELLARLRLAETDMEAALHAPLPPELLRAARDQLVGETLIAREAERARVATVDDASVAAQRRTTEDAVGGAVQLSRLLETLGVPPSELASVLRRQVLVGSFLRANLEGATNVGDAELESAFRAGDHPFVGAPFEAVRDGFRVWLGRRAVERAVSRWVTALAARTAVRVLVEY